jgi:hypothetical protein
MVKKFLFLVIPLLVFAGEDGGVPGYIFIYGVGARSLGMGKAFTAIADGAEGLYYNPGGLGTLEDKDWLFFHSKIFDTDVRYSAVGYGMPVWKYGSVGAMVIWLTTPGFQARDRLGEPLGKYEFNQFATLLSYGHRFSSKLFAGVSLKSIYSRLYIYNPVGFGADIGFIYKPLSTLMLGGTVHNIIPPRLRYVFDIEVFQPVIRTGISYKPFEEVLLAFDLLKSATGDFKPSIGAEFNVADRLAFRGGLDNNEASGGFGIRVGKGAYTFIVDYTFSMHHASELGMDNTHKISLRWTFKGAKVWANAEPEIFNLAPDTLGNFIWIYIHTFPGENVAHWKLVIKKSDTDVVVRTFEGWEAPPLRIVFDGLDDYGNLIPEGEYNYELEIEDLSGKKRSSRGRLFRAIYPEE